MAFPVGEREMCWWIDFEEYYEEEDIPETTSTSISAPEVHAVHSTSTSTSTSTATATSSHSDKTTSKAETPKEKKPAAKKSAAKNQTSIMSFFKKKWSFQVG